MTEVLFTQSAAGGMLYSGSFQNVACLSLGLSMGDIRAPLSDDRARFLQSTVMIPAPEFSDVGLDLLRAAQEGINSILSAVALGEPIRVWYSVNLPDEYCGLCHLLSILSQEAVVYAVELPAMSIGDGCVTRFCGWGNVEPESFFRYIPSTRLLSSTEKTFLSSLWRELVRENGPLRAVVNGTLHTVDADFYDGFLRRELDTAPEEFSEAHIIGNILGKYALGIPDSLVALRIEEFIGRGELIPVTVPPSDSPSYHRKLRKA